MPPRSWQPPTRGRRRGRSNVQIPSQPPPPPGSEQSSNQLVQDSIHPWDRSRSPSGEHFPSTPLVSDDDGSNDVHTNTTQHQDGRALPPVLISPIKRRARAAAPTINKQNDLAVWSLTDEEIIGMCESQIFCIARL